MAHARMCVIPFAGEHAHLLDATDKVPPRVLHFSAFHYHGFYAQSIPALVDHSRLVKFYPCSTAEG